MLRKLRRLTGWVLAVGLAWSGAAHGDEVLPPPRANGPGQVPSMTPPPGPPPVAVPPGGPFGAPVGGHAGAGPWSEGDQADCMGCAGCGGHGGHGRLGLRGRLACCGHACRIDNCATIPPGAQPAPIGTYVNRWIHLQETKAEMDDFVIYKHMWFRGGRELGPMGRYQLDLMTQRLAQVPFPVVIETSLNDEIDADRRDIIIALLKSRGFTDPTRVIVAFPIAEGLYGDEADRIYQGYIRGFAGGLNQGVPFGFGGVGFGGGFGF